MTKRILLVTALAVIFSSEGCSGGSDTNSSAGGSSGVGGGTGGSSGVAGSVSGSGGAGSGATSGGGTGGSAAAGAGGGAGTSSGSGGEAGGTAGSGATSCDNPLFTTSDTNGGWSNGGYYVHNNVWNASEAGPETLFACAYDNWYVTSTQTDTTSVKAYPNVHLDIANLNGAPISNYTVMTSTFAATAPQVGIYDVAYDIWLDGVGWGNGTTEVMIWTENRQQAPLGSVVAPQTTFGGKEYDVYRYTSSADGGVHVISLLSKETQTSGSVDIKEILNFIVAKGWLASSATINQIGYGVEICSTKDQPATFYFTDFSVTMN